MEENKSEPEIDRQSNQFPKSCIGYLGWLIWFGAIIFFGQNTWASMFENEPRAAIIYAAFTLLLLLGGAVVFMSRKYKNNY
ncbi:MAG: hypothetical protein HOA61_01030 [Bacteroidetes bacterium]|jgi:membrane protein DedA with SNARE-associated domain|nr:hypothetical protein [Chloroflexota bacterium]MBT4306200.1 hypothetical protein [Chloroflexota bacterium]MBT6834600.1 hypothetical protein [Bacteroidota bacterium]MBT6988451.1 hypothetical protein [Chloroflexota bacterium]